MDEKQKPERFNDADKNKKWRSPHLVCIADMNKDTEAATPAGPGDGPSAQS